MSADRDGAAARRDGAMTRPLRIASVCRLLPTPTDSGAGVFVLRRLAAMNGGANVDVVQPVPFFPFIKPLPAWARPPSRTLDAVAVRHAPMFYIPKFFKTADAFWLARAIEREIERLHRQEPLDAIDAHFGYPDGAGCVRLGRRLGIPVFVTLRGVEQEYLEVPGIGSQLLWAVRNAAGCVAVSHSLRERFVRAGIDPNQIEVIHNAIDSRIFRVADRDAARRALSLGPGPLVVSVGNLVAGKRHHVLLDAFAGVRRRFPDARLAIIGGVRFESAYPDELRARARALGVESATRFVGSIPPDEVATWLQAADLFALATEREGCCNAVLEALAAGLPVVTTPAGDNAYFVEDGVNGYIVPVDDADALERAIVRALERRDWDADGISRRLLAEVGSWDTVARKVLEYFVSRLPPDGRPTRQRAGAVELRPEPGRDLHDPRPAGIVPTSNGRAR